MMCLRSLLFFVLASFFSNKAIANFYEDYMQDKKIDVQLVPIVDIYFDNGAFSFFDSDLISCEIKSINLSLTEKIKNNRQMLGKESIWESKASTGQITTPDSSVKKSDDRFIFSRYFEKKDKKTGEQKSLQMICLVSKKITYVELKSSFLKKGIDISFNETKVKFDKQGLMDDLLKANEKIYKRKRPQQPVKPQTSTSQ